jgi:pyruvate,water dikinase
MAGSRRQGEVVRQGFPSPFDVSIPPACEGWEDLYAYHVLFAEDRREFEESRFWFHDGVHSAEPLYPFDAVYVDVAVGGINQSCARLFVLPPTLGLEYRLLNGYCYVSANAVADEAVLARREELYSVRSSYYYERWEGLERRWREKVEATIRELRSLEVPDLPEFEDEAIVTEGRGTGSRHALLVAYDRLLESLDRVGDYHFELVSLGYAAYAMFYELCRDAFPGVADQTIARMVSGIETAVLRPDEELKRLARRALDLGLGERLRRVRAEEELEAALGGDRAGKRWLAEYERTKDPWFHFSYGNGLYHDHRSWVDDATLPVRTIGFYVRQLEAGRDISRPSGAIVAERERITSEHRSRLSGDALDRFDEQLALARTVFPHVEGHNFYVDHWYHSIFWNKVREFGAVLTRYDFLRDREDVFYLRPDELRSSLDELRLFWSSGYAGAPRGPAYWPPLVERRKAIVEAMRAWEPPPALGQAPEMVTDPVLVVHWGITTERVQGWLADAGGARAGKLHGIAGSPGVAEGPARVILRSDGIGELEEGEILVAPSTSTSWTPAFATIAGAVLDVGGAMCHAAIVAREYGLPAVVGTGSATKRIRTGDRIRVDGGTGVVTILT